jgi:NAD+ synthase (glutamine-hydrolysing)
VHGNRVLNCAVVIHRGAVLGVAPKSYLPTYREFYERRWFAPGDDRTAPRSGRATEVPFGNDLLFRPTDVPGPGACTSRSARTCGCRCRPAPRRRSPARRCWPTCPAARSPSPAPRTAGCCAQRERALQRGLRLRAAGQGESTTDLSWDGQTMVYECGDLLGRDRAVPRRPRARSSTSTSTGSARSGCGRAPSTTTGGRRRGLRGDFRTVEFELDPPTGDIGLRRKVDRFPFVPDDVARLALDCYEAYNIQVSGLEQRLHAIGQPKVVIGVSGGLDSTHALIVAAKAMDRLGRRAATSTRSRCRASRPARRPSRTPPG